MRHGRLVACAVAVALTVSGVVVVAGASPAAASGGGVASVPSRPLASRAPRPRATDVSDPAWRDPSVSAPSAGVADVTLPASGYAQAGDLPVYVGASDQASPVSVRVQVFDQATASALGARFFVVRVTRSDGSRYEAPLSIQVDYAGVRRAFGGDFALRLRLQRVDACVLQDPSCAVPVDVPAHADLAAQRLVADVTAESDPTAAPTADPLPGIGPSVYSMSSGTGGQAGDYSASPMPMTERWQVGVSSGDFNYSYPVPVPPPVGGPSPSISLDYSSQSVDGRTNVSNSQPSQVGEGWSLENGYIERRFKSCKDDGAPSNYTGNLCWAPTMEYYLHFGGKSGEMVQSTSTNEWRLRDDPAWRIQSWTGGTNGDNDGEYFTLYTPDGTKYWFGYGIEPRNTPTRYTNSTLNVPVFAGSGEPCYNSASYTLSFCSQAWRWNLDRVQDPAQNVESLFYAKEANYYRRDSGNSSLVSQYDRASEPTRIEYSKRSGSENVAAPSVVTFTTAYRCAAQSSCPAPTPSNGSSFPDVPNDLICTSPTSCPGAGQSSPSFFSGVQISRITTYILNSGGGLSDVATVDLAYSFPVTTDGTDPALWLRMITRTGTYGAGSVALPPVLIGGLHLPNRVDYDNGGGLPQTDKYRVNQIVSETGGETDVTYGSPHPCSAASLPPPGGWDHNATDCFPQWFTPPGGTFGVGAFHKYVTTQVVDDDLVAASPSRTTTYTYEDTPAWHYVNELNVPQAVQSWSDYRGYAQVEVLVSGDAYADPRTTRYFTFRGMNGDRLANGTARSASVTDGAGNAYTDDLWLAGRTLESDDYSQWGTWFGKHQHRYWRAQTLPGPTTTVWPSQPHSAQYVRESVTADLSIDTSPGGDPNAWRSHQVDNTYSATYGVLTSSYDYANSSLLDTCRKLTYAVNVITSTNPSAEAWVIAVPYQDRTVDGVCTGGTVVKNTDLYYDGSTTLGATPTWGRVTQTSVTATPSPTATTKIGYDGYNRVISTTSPNLKTTTTAYAPASGFPYTSITVTNPKAQQSITRLEPAWSTPVAVTDPNGNLTTITRDELGRVTAVARPGDVAGTPSTTYSYVVAQGSPSRVDTERLLSGSNYLASFTYYDGLGDAIESQAEGPNGGRVVVATKYDAQGHPRLVSAPFYNASAVGTGAVNPADTGLPTATGYTYDTLGRQTDSITLASNVEQWRSSVSHFEWSDVASFPVHSDVTTTLDVFGRPTRVTEHPTSGAADTNYTYTTRGDLDTVVDASGNKWDYDYDLAGRRTTSADPDRGTWHYGYDADGNVLTEADALTATVMYTYDELDRRLTASAGATALAAWTYDTATAGKGLPATATRYSGGNTYTAATPAYDSRGRPTGATYTIPAAEGGLAGTYTYGYGYDAADHRTTVAYPAVGSLLGAETVSSEYSGTGYPTRLSGTSTYVDSTSYQNDGRLSGRQIGVATEGIARAYTYDSLGRLATFSGALTHAGVTTTVQSEALGYDHDGNLTTDTDAVTGQSECYRYTDGLDRLTAAFTSASNACTTADTTAPDPYDLTYTYNAIGNTTTVTDAGVPTTPTYNPSGPTSVRPHAMTGYGTTTLGYDANGALTTRTVGTAATTLTWDPLHTLATSIAPDSTVTTYVTDTAGNRLVKHNPDGTGTLYLDGMEITAPLTTGAAPTTATRYYGPATRIAGGADAGLWWQLANQQNSATVTVNAATGAARAQRYTPYGAHRNATSTLPIPRGFLDKTEDASGYDDLGARLYDPAVAQFTRPDPLMNPTKPQTLNPYAYSGNNPTSFSDPSGYEPHHNADGSWSGNGCANGECTASVNDVENNKNVELAGQAQFDKAVQIATRRLINLNRTKRDQPDLYDQMKDSYCLGATPSPGSCEQRYRDDAVRDALLNTSTGDFILSAATFTAVLVVALGTAGQSLDYLATLATDASAVDTELMAQAEVAAAEASTAGARSVDEVLSGLPQGTQDFVRTVPDESTLQTTFEELTEGGTPTVWKNYSGDVFELPDGTQIGMRGTSSSGGATIDIRIPGQDPFKIHIG